MIQADAVFRERAHFAVQDDDLRLPALRSFLLVLAGASFLGWYALVHTPANTPLLLLVSAASLLTPSCYGLARRSPAWAGGVLLLGLTALVVLALLLGSPHSAVAWLALPAIMACVLLPSLSGVLWGTAASLTALALLWPQPDWSLVALPAAAATCAWLALRPLHKLLDWSWQRSLEATTLAEQLRDQRGKLNRTIKDLDASYHLLQQSNHELAMARREADMLRDLRHRFATNLSHELRTPLNIIIGFSKLIYRKPQLYGYANWTESLLRDLAEIHTNAAYLSKLVDDVVDLARVDAFAMPIRREQTDLKSLIEETVAVVHSLALEKGLAIVVNISDKLPPLLLDPQRIRQVTFNLLNNAIRFTDTGSVTVQAIVGEDEVVVSVKDTGRGIPEHELDTIFNEFYQVSRPKEEPGAGKGLGLAIAKRLIQLHGGRIWAESSLGQGATFSFSLPLSDKTTARVGQTTPLPVRKPQIKPKVLVLDQEGASTAYLSRRLDAYDFLRVSADENLPAVTERTHPLAIIANGDWSDDNNGQELLQQLPDEILFIQASLPSRQWLSENGEFAAVLTKPVSEEDVLGAIAALLPEPANERTVLLVDDDRGFLQLTARMIEANAANTCHVLSAYNGQNALAKARRYRPDIVLLDLLMPDMSGFEVLACLHQDAETKDIPVVAVTAATPGEDQLATKGATFTLTKKGAFRPGELIALLDAALRGPTGRLLPGSGEEQP